MMWGDGFGMGGWIFAWIMMLVVVALVIVGIVLLVRGLSGRHDRDQAGYQPPPPGSGPANTAIQILEERYARGEIDQEEFLRRRADLLGGQR